MSSDFINFAKIDKKLTKKQIQRGDKHSGFQQFDKPITCSLRSYNSKHLYKLFCSEGKMYSKHTFGIISLKKIKDILGLTGKYQKLSKFQKDFLQKNIEKN